MSEEAKERVVLTQEQFFEHLKKAAIMEREACAQVVQKLMDGIDPWDPDSAKSLARDAIEKIQARGK